MMMIIYIGVDSILISIPECDGCAEVLCLPQCASSYTILPTGFQSGLQLLHEQLPFSLIPVQLGS